MSTTNENHAQVVVIGGGPGGYPAALEAARLGMDVTLVSDEPELGGVCLQRGCIPSKALLHAAALLFETVNAGEWGLNFTPPIIDLDALRSRKEQVISQLVGGIAQLCKARKVKRIQARARFVDSNTLSLQGPDAPERLTFDHAILASGSRPIVPGPFNIDDRRIMTSTGALELPDQPKRLLVIGGGYIGLELGTVYASLGSEVTVVEMTAGLLPGADRDLVRPLAKRLGDIFDAIHLNTKLVSLEPTAHGIVAVLEGEGVASPQTFDRVLISVGRRPNSEDLGLENTRVHVNQRGFVEVDRQQRTSDPNILAVGDVAGDPMLAHKATREGKVAAQVLAGESVAFEPRAIPAVVFTDPELAWCGITEAEAKEQGVPFKAARFPWKASGRAMSLGRTEGMTKMIFDPETERVLGVGIVGPGAGEMIAEGMLAVEMAAVARDVADTIHAHPTLSETIMESAERFLGEATHIT